jgi:broad specificity phosphatase PhoE
MNPLRTLPPALLLLLLGWPGPASAQAIDAGAGTTVIVVRHAEKAADHPDDPSLDEAGERRAAELLRVLDDARIDAVYSTQLRRTLATAGPLAARRGLEVTVRPIARGEASAHSERLAREILAAHPGGSVLVVGHSNTVPELVRALSGAPVEEMTEAEYDHLYVVVIGGDGRPRVIRARFGAASPAP